ncbi:interaptin-like [Clytia hemisphaerica]|uniref:Uncharacterized protein n=1 Tax=Clytia hemisphaerica TaxID=252671 RepID=A0A7M5V3P8_9CNID|eukprot:TCONS_00072883-protein
MWWRATSLMTEDLKRSSKVRLSKGFYRGENQIKSYESGCGNTPKDDELCQIHRTLISYKDVTLPDKIYGGRNKQSYIVTDDNKSLQRKIMKELNVGPLEFSIAMKTYQNVVTVQNEENIQEDVYVGGIEGINTSPTDSENNTKVQRSKDTSPPNDLALMEELCTIKGDYGKMKGDYDSIVDRNTAAETEIRRLSLVKEESDLVHREEADALCNTIDDLNKKLTTARKEVEEMGMDIKECIADTTSQLKQHFDVLLAEEKEQNQALLAKKEADICEKDSQIFEIKKYFERELDAVKEQGVKRLERMLSIEKEKSEMDQKTIQELRKSLDADQKILLDKQHSLQQQTELVNGQASQLVELNDKKAVIKKKLFKATKEVKEAKDKVAQGQEAFNKQQQELEDLNAINEILTKSNEEERKKHIEELTQKESELVKMCDSSKQQLNISEQKMGLLKTENDALKLAQVESELTHAAEMAKQNEVLVRAKNAHKDEIGEAKEQIDQLKREAGQMDFMHQETLAVKYGNLEESELTICFLQKEKAICEKKLETASKSVLCLEKRLNQREVEIRARLEDISAQKKKENADKATIEKQKVSMEKIQNDLKREKKRIESLIRERNAYRDEAHTNSIQKIEANKKLEATKEHLQTVKKEYECKIAQMQPIQETKAVGKQKQKKRKRKSKQVASNDIEANTLTIATQTNKELTNPQEAKRNDLNEDRPKKSDLDNGKIQKVAKVQKSFVQRKSPSTISKNIVSKSDVIFDQHDNERPWGVYDTSLVTFCIGIWFLLIKVCSIVTNDDSLW